MSGVTMGGQPLIKNRDLYIENGQVYEAHTIMNLGVVKGAPIPEITLPGFEGKTSEQVQTRQNGRDVSSAEPLTPSPTPQNTWDAGKDKGFSGGLY